MRSLSREGVVVTEGEHLLFARCVCSVSGIVGRWPGFDWVVNWARDMPGDMEHVLNVM